MFNFHALNKSKMYYFYQQSGKRGPKSSFSQYFIQCENIKSWASFTALFTSLLVLHRLGRPTAC